jgi:hypothetical protein
VVFQVNSEKDIGEFLAVVAVIIGLPLLVAALQDPALFGGLILWGLIVAKRLYARQELQGSPRDGSTLT